MDKKEVGTRVAEAGIVAKGFLGKAKDRATKMMDQNDDGKFDINDVAQIAGAVGGAAKKTAATIKTAVDNKGREMELKTLQPIFGESITDATFALTKLIRICEHDKKRSESEVCKGSIGYFTDHKDMKMVNIYKENTDDFCLKFIPDSSYEFYYVDPCDRDCYIALDEYFSYLKVARVNELQKLARALGAKHFRVTYKEEKASLTSQNMKADIKAGANASGERNLSQNDFSTVEIAAEMDCAGHEPSVPELHYLKKDTNIRNMIDLRMNKQSPIYHQKVVIKLSNSSGMRENDAIKIDAVLKGLKCAGNASVVSEAKRESRRLLEYEIDY